VGDITAPGIPTVVIGEAAGGVNADEFADGVQTQVTLPTGTLAGDTITLTVTPPGGGDAITIPYEVTDADITAGVSEVTIPNGVDGISADGAYSVVATVTDTAGNSSAPSAAVGFNLNTTFAARDDLDNLDLGALQVITSDPVTASDLVILGALEGTGGADSNLSFTVSEGDIGSVNISVQQTALVAVADAVNIEIYNAAGERVYVGTTGGDPLVGDVIGLELLGLTGNDTLTATVSGLEPGSYTVVVRKSDSALAAVVEDVELADLGDSGIVLGPENQEAVLEAVEAALNDDFPPVNISLPPLPPTIISLGSTVRDLLENTLDLTGELGAGELIETLQEGLTGPVLNIVLGGVIDPVLDALAEALLSNTLTLLETTEVTATLTEYSFSGNNETTGNVIDPNPGAEGEDGEDTVTPDTTVTDIDSNSNQLEPTSEIVDGVTVFTIQGQYGFLVIAENGDYTYTYTANGEGASSGQSEVFTYTISDGVISDTAELVINIDATTPPVDAVDDLGTAEIVVTPITTTETLSNSATSVLSLLGAGNIQTAVDFNIAENSTGSAIIDISATGAVDVLNSSSLALQVRDASGTFVNVGNSNTNTGLIDVLGL
ncbi:hypothetical protein ACTXNB_14255, partial [Psychrobacter alimentarius]